MTDDDIAKARDLIARSGAPIWVQPSWRQTLDGWSAALDEVERQRSERTADLAMWRATEADLATNRRRADEAEVEVERLTKLHAEKHAQNERMCAEIERLDGEVAKLTADCHRWQVLASQASELLVRQTSEIERCAKTLAECGVMLDRIATIASEAFGPFPAQGVEANLTAIEHGIAKLRIENATLLEQVDATRWLALVKFASRCKPLASASKHDGEAVTLREGDALWHDGPGWYYTIDDYPDEGSCGAFASRVLAEQHARIAGFVVGGADLDEQRKAGA